MSFDLGESYRNARLRIAELVHDDIGAVPVPATPLWNVHDVIAHLSGIVDDVRNGNMEGVTTDPWTAAQVERGATRTIDELLASWADGAPLIEGFLSSPEGASAYRAVLDVHTHEADLLGALGRPVVLPEEFLCWIAPVLTGDFRDSCAEAGLDPVDVGTSPLELFRSRLGRRTAAEVTEYDWSADPAPYLDTWFVFGRAQHSLGEI